MEFEWKEPIDIPDGSHTGEITKVTYRTDPYEYTDVSVKPTEHDVELKYGCPSSLTPNTKLGRLMQAFGARSEKGSKIDPEKVLVGKQVQFMTMKKKSGDKEFTEIVEDSLKPLAAETVTI